MSCVTGHAFKPERIDASLVDFFPIVGHKVTVIIAIRGKCPRCIATRTSFVKVVEAIGSFLEDGFIR